MQALWNSLTESKFYKTQDSNIAGYKSWVQFMETTGSGHFLLLQAVLSGYLTKEEIFLYCSHKRFKINQITDMIAVYFILILTSANQGKGLHGTLGNCN